MSTSLRPVHLCECAICQQQSDAVVVRYHAQINLLLSRLAEPQRRWYVGVLSQEPDSPSEAHLALITGLDEKTIQRGRHEMVNELEAVPVDRQRHEGGGRPRSEKKIQN
jgi:hypothetical protein